MDYDRSSTASARDFENTAIKKLQAEGVPYNVAHAFVTIGIVQKSQNYEKIRDAVCPMKYQQFFIPRSDKDFSDPLRKGGPGAMVPQVLENKHQRFYTEFSMSDIESVKFAKSFPEFHVVSSGKTFNQHSYYANKRYAETELLVSMVYRHALSNSSDFDPRKLIDLGGNAVWHEKRDRSYVHCDNPVLGFRDKARYITRQVFSGEDPAGQCRHVFQECSYQSDYAIAVHSTYDLTPKKIAQAMMSKSVRVFYGVVNILPGLSDKRAGVYEVDGMVVTVCRPAHAKPYVKYTFKHDTALEYTHGLAEIVEYSRVKCKYEFVDSLGKPVSYIYKIESVRGNSLVFSIVKGEGDYSTTSALWSAPRSSTYTVSIPQLETESIEVQREFFDRLVMEAAGSRQKEDYDITALFKYAKSLRQRVSINGIVLSSGYCMHPDELIVAVIAAYCIAAAYRRESTNFFQKATSQIILRRSRGLFRDTFTMSALFVKYLVDSVSTIFSQVTWYASLVRLVKRWDNSTFPVQVTIDKPHAGKGVDYDPSMLQPLPVRVSQSGLVSVPSCGVPFTPLDVGGWNSKLKVTRHRFGDQKKKYYSYGLPVYSESELPRPGTFLPYELNLPPTEYPTRSEEYRNLCNSSFLKSHLRLDHFSSVPLVLANGDRMYRAIPASQGERAAPPLTQDQFIGVTSQYLIIRGVGSRAVALPAPRVYAKGHCILFVLMYEHDESSMLNELKRIKTQRVASAPAFVGTSVSRADSSVDAQFATVDTAVDSGSSPSRVQSVHSGLEDERIFSTVKRYQDEATARASVAADIDAGYYTMTGALQLSGQLTPRMSPATTPIFGAQGAVVSRIVDAPRSEPGIPSIPPSVADSDITVELPPLVSNAIVALDHVAASASSRTAADVGSSVESDSQAKLALQEYIEACKASERIAVESSEQCINLARAAANVGDSTSYSKWASVAQGMPGDPIIVKVSGDTWTNCQDGSVVEHMAVSDGIKVYDRLVQLPEDGIYVTSEVMKIYTGAAIKNSMELALEIDYECDVVSMNGVAGSGKTTSIVQGARPSHVVLCETKAALIDTKSKLLAKRDACTRAYTVDSYLANRMSMDCDVLWIDESFRLHAAKIYAVVRLLRPSKVFCFGDVKQIPVLPYIPDFDFSWHLFPFTSSVFKGDTWRSPADVCLALSVPDYYGVCVTTHSTVLRSITGPDYFSAQEFHTKPESTVLLVYTQSQKDDLKKQGVTNVMTIGESQGSTFDDVILFRDSPLGKALYYDKQQTLVAFTRHRRTFRYVTAVAGNDDSAAYAIIRWLRDNISDLKLAAHIYRDSSADSDLDSVVDLGVDDDSMFGDYDNTAVGS